MTIANSALCASLAIYHLISNARSWNNCEIYIYILFQHCVCIHIADTLTRPLAKPGPDQVGLDRTGLDRQNSDQINNKVPTQTRHMKSLGHQLRLLLTFAGVLQEKVCTRASFNKILTKLYIRRKLRKCSLP